MIKKEKIKQLSGKNGQLKCKHLSSICFNFDTSLKYAILYPKASETIGNNKTYAEVGR